MSTPKKKPFYKKKVFIIPVAVLLILFIGIMWYAKVNSISKISASTTPVFVAYADEYAVNGYDAVSYHVNSPVQGSKDYQYEWKGSTWLFSSEENLEAFKDNPEGYSPKYGGYCSFAVSTGFTAHSNPEEWHIEDGKLYLFSNAEVKNKWLENKDESMKACEKSWSEVKN